MTVQTEHSEDKNKEKEAYRVIAERLIEELGKTSEMLSVSIRKHSQHSTP